MMELRETVEDAFSTLLLGFTTPFNILGHQRRFRDRACSEALISSWGSSTCRKPTTRDPRLYFPSEGSHLFRIFTLWKNPSTTAGIKSANLGSRAEYDNHWTTGVDSPACEPRLSPQNICQSMAQNWVLRERRSPYLWSGFFNHS